MKKDCRREKNACAERKAEIEGLKLLGVSVIIDTKVWGRNSKYKFKDNREVVILPEEKGIKIIPV